MNSLPDALPDQTAADSAGAAGAADSGESADFADLAESGGAAIAARALVKTYPKQIRALDGLSFTVAPGTLFALLGPNGAGKSTTVKILTTLTRADSGDALVAGHDVRREPDAVRRAIGVVGQKNSGGLSDTGRENLVLQGRMYGLRGAELKERVNDLLQRFGLWDAANRVVRGYSGGMHRRLDIAMGLVHRPRVLFLDEPTTGLDPEVRAEMWEEISALRDDGVTILLTTHYLEEADRLADRVAIVDQGRIVVAGTSDELKGRLRGDSVQIDLAEPPGDGEVRKALAEIDGIGEVVLGERGLRARAADGAAAVPVILAALENQGVRVASVMVSRPSLDDVYLRHTGRSFHDADGRARRACGEAPRDLLVRRAPALRSSLAGARYDARFGGRLVTAVAHSAYHTVRQIRGLLRQPVFVAITLIQPFIWLLLFGALFKRVVDIPGFQAPSYVDYLAPGIVVMTGFFAGGWNGVAILNDMQRGTLDRFLVTPARRIALIAGPLGYQAVATVIQSVIILAVGFALGARYSGPVGLIVFLAAVVLLCSALAAMSNAIALLVRQEESLIGFVQFTALPLTFLSTALMPANLVPDWVATIAKFNPVNWAIEVGRSALGADPDWGLIGTRMLLLLAFAALLTWGALAAFRTYQRSA